MDRPRKKKTPPKMVEPPEEEVRQLADWMSDHPWSLTYGDFLKRAQLEYGLKLKSFVAVDPKGRSVKMPYLEGQDGNRIYLPGKLEATDQLDPFTTGSLCRRMRVPPEDFGLDPEEPDEGGDEDFKLD